MNHAIVLKVSSSERKRVVLLTESVQFPLDFLKVLRFSFPVPVVGPSAKVELSLAFAAENEKTLPLALRAPCGFFANAGRVDVRKVWVANKAILRLRSRKLIFLLFSKTKGFFRKKKLYQITYLPKSYLRAKTERSRFFNCCHSMLDIS